MARTVRSLYADRAVEVRPDSLEDLRFWLANQGIPLSRWGTGPTKSVADLWSELQCGESVLTADPPQRHVRAVAVIIRRNDAILIEAAQTFRTGISRERSIPPTEKMLSGESVETAAIRCVQEELGITLDERALVPGTHTVAENERYSQSFPELLSRYTVHEVEIRVPGLPDTPFSTKESLDGTDTAIQDHYWEWR
jgi:hypothetical protein